MNGVSHLSKSLKTAQKCEYEEKHSSENIHVTLRNGSREQ